MRRKVNPLKKAERQLAIAQRKYDQASFDQLIVHLKFENAKDALEEAQHDVDLVREFL